MPMVVIVFIVKKRVRARRGLSSLCKAQLSFQVIYFSLHGPFVIPSLGYVTAHTRMASASLSGVYSPFSKPFVFFVPAMLRV